MKRSLFIIFLIFCGLPSFAQHDLYNWQVKGYAGIAHFFNTNQKTIDYLQPDDNMWYRFELGHSLGKTFGLAVSASMGNIRGMAPQGGYFTTEVQMTSLRLYFYTDNGWLLKESSLVSPYFFGGYGLSTLKDAPRHDQYQQALPFGLGFKFRIADRWQLDFQTEAVYHTTASENDLFAQQNKYNNSFLHTGISLAYNFGFKPSSFKASRFYSNIQPATAPVTAVSTINSSTPMVPDSLNPMADTTIAKLNTRTTTLDSPELRSVTPRMVVIRDTIRVKENNYSSVADTLSISSIRKQIQDSISTVNRQSLARENVRSQQAALTASQAKAIRERERALAEYDQRTRRANDLRQSDIARTPDSYRANSTYRATAPSTPVNPPATRVYSNRRPVVTPVNPIATVRVDDDRRDLDEVTRKNLQLRYAYDSLNASRNQDTILSTQVRQQNAAYTSLNNKLMRYMQDQANVNDSLRQRLNFYEGALARTPQAATSAPPVASLPANEIAFDTTVFFNKNSFQILPLNFNNLLGCAAYLKANPQQRLQLTGYADRTGKPEYNLLLSRKRVEAVSSFLQYRGIAKERILMQYFGEANSKDLLVPLDRKVILNILD